MPELPEVEHICRWLDPQLAGLTISELWIHPGGERQLPQGAELVTERLTNRRIARVTRRGKWVLCFLEDGGTLVIHLKMTGQLWPAHTADAGVPEYTRLSLQFIRGGRLDFVDIRRFGWLQVWTPAERIRWLGTLGPEPVPCLPEPWAAGLKGRRTVKSALLDQRVVAGIGNIYADEILFHCGIDPRRPLMRLSSEERLRLRESIERQMQAAVDEREGEPDQKRVGGGDRSVKALFNWRVFQRKGEPCVQCSGPIAYATVAQRGTYYCPRCQR